MSDSLYFRQVEIGPMSNFVYLVGSTETRKVAVIDAAWDIEGILRLAAADGMEITHALVTHTHPDHVGSWLRGAHIEGVEELLGKVKAKVVVHKAEAEFLKSLSPSDIIRSDSGDKINVGGIEIQLIHTPGHTPGSQCFLVGGFSPGQPDRLIAGDTLFIGSCGRVDLPGSSAEEMYHSLTQKLMQLSDDTILFPGHNYAAEMTSTIGAQKKSNPYLRFHSLNAFLAAMGYE
ncbi:MAG: MBL fold metallo-hydrolase [Deltaproteobacteria bacterium]|nr:MBL fold metallo-hydrolase [Deltaproteobacteria bacterium]